MRITSLNANGIRAAYRKGFFQWLTSWQPDVVCLQELKAHLDQLGPEFYPDNYHSYYFPAQRKGYSGVGILSRYPPDKIIQGLGDAEFTHEGRYLEAQFGKLSVISLYLPSGSAKDERQLVKYRLMNDLEAHLKALQRKQREYIICGDWNIAHQKIDIKNWRGNQKNSGFLPEERAWMDKLFGELGWVDAFRIVNQQSDQYTWWSNRGQAWANNVGWRIDYQIISPKLCEYVSAAHIYKDERFSDHAPLTIDYRSLLPE